jgi:L-Ala-D/L-Glu epimerase
MADVEIRQLQLTPLRVPFTMAFRHASAERTETSSLWVEATSARGATGYGESCPRPYVTGETVDSARAFFARHDGALRSTIVDLPSLRDWMARHDDELDRNPAAWCAIELAILDLLAKEQGRTVDALLSLPPLAGEFHYSAVLGDADARTFEALAARFQRQGFTDFKIKLSGDVHRDLDKVAALRRLSPQPRRTRVDANNLWHDAEEATGFLISLEHRFFAVEEPIRPNEYAGLARIADALDCRVILDESCLRADQIGELPGAPDRWLINVRVSKMGGLLRSLDVVATARRAGVGIIVGAQVGETSLLTRAALTVASAAGDARVAQEGAFGTFLLERDVCDPPLMFSAGGVLAVTDHPSLQRPGFGWDRLSHA